MTSSISSGALRLGDEDKLCGTGAGAEGDNTMTRVAACLVENDHGEILFVQRAYGSRKGKWTLPGGHVDHHERSRHAAYRETKEETGIIVEITSVLFTGNKHPITVFTGRPLGGNLHFQRKECMDARWRNPWNIELWELAFGYDSKALGLWKASKQGTQTKETKR